MLPTVLGEGSSGPSDLTIHAKWIAHGAIRHLAQRRVLKPHQMGLHTHTPTHTHTYTFMHAHANTQTHRHEHTHTHTHTRA